MTISIGNLAKVRSYSSLLLILSITLTCSQSPKCMTQKNSCSCQTDKGLIDLSPLDSKSSTNPRFTDIPSLSNQNEKFSYNPCTAFTQGTTGSCSNVAVCETYFNNYFCGGSQESATFDSSGTTLAIKYSCPIASQGQSTVNLVCDPQIEGKFECVTSNLNTYTFKLTSKYACPGHGGGGSGGISFGTVLCIIAIVLAVLYLLLGMAFMRFYRHASGIEMIPNVGFWRELPGLVKDGAVFVFSPITKKAGYQEMS